MEETKTTHRKLSDRPEYQWTMLCLGWILLLSAPLIGALPGPGFLIVFPVGLAIILKHSRWAKRRYARITRDNPEYGYWINWAMRRSKLPQTPDFPPVKRDLLYLFRRDDVGQEMP